MHIQFSIVYIYILHLICTCIRAAGRFLLVSKTGRVEKTVDGHKGAVLGVRWAVPDGSALLTCEKERERESVCVCVCVCVYTNWLYRVNL